MSCYLCDPDRIVFSTMDEHEAWNEACARCDAYYWANPVLIAYSHDEGLPVSNGRGGPMNLIAAENYAAIAAAVAQHKPRLEEMQAYECMNGDCDHDTECPVEDVVVCSYCFWLNTEINDELIVNAVLAENCPVCVAAYPKGYPSVTEEP